MTLDLTEDELALTQLLLIQQTARWEFWLRTNPHGAPRRIRVIRASVRTAKAAMHKFQTALRS